jgi:hypothetical protein
MARRPVSNITGKPVIPVPGRLDIAVLQQLADNTRERLRQLDAEVTYLRSIADSATAQASLTGLQQSLSTLQTQLALLAQQAGGALSAESAFDPPPPQVPSVRAGDLILLTRDAAGFTIAVDPVPAAIFAQEFA